MTFFIAGCGDTEEGAEADHDRNLKAFLERARERNLRLNADKLKMTKFLTLDTYSLGKDSVWIQKKVEAIEKMPAPKDAKADQRLLG